MDVRTVAFVVLLLLGCGSHTMQPGGGNPPQTSSSSGAEQGTTTFVVGQAPVESVDAGTPSVASYCDPPDASRPATSGENAAYCVCTLMGPPMGQQLQTWECYGPSPSQPQPNPTCSYTFGNPGGSGSCLTIWSKCSDGKEYVVSCVDRTCDCLIDGEIVVRLEPRDVCPLNKADVNADCGWAIQ